MVKKLIDNNQHKHIISLARDICGSPFVFLNDVDLNDNVFSPCRVTITQRDPLEITDLANDRRFSKVDLLNQNSDLNYYFGMPLLIAGVNTFMTLCVYKNKNERLLASQKASFLHVASLAKDLIEASISQTRYVSELSDRNKKLVQLFEQSREPLMTLEPPNWCFSSGNPAAIRLFNLVSEEQFIQIGPAHVSPEFQPDGMRSADKAQAEVMKAMQEGSHFFEWVHMTVDGVEFPCTVFLNRISEGERRYLHATVRDISVQQHLKNDLNNQLAINREILNATTEGILLVDHQSRSIQQYNQRFANMWNIPAELIEVNNITELFNHLLGQLIFPESFVTVIEELYQNPLEESSDVLLFNDERVFEQFSTPYILNGEVKGRIWFFKDVTEKRMMEKMLNQSSRLAAIGQLAAGVGHEINNPLAVIKGYLNKVMRKKNIPVALKQELTIIQSASEKIEKIITGLRSFAKIERSASSNSFDVSGLLYEIENMLTAIYLNEGIKLEFDYTKLPQAIIVQGDRGKLEQALVNLISNAKDSTEGQQLRLIRVSARLNAEKIELSVSDNGAGIPEDIQDKIFEPFFTTKDVGKGTGIGLSLVYRFIKDEFGGEINITDSNVGRGVRFELSLPMRIGSDVNCEDQETSQEQTTKATSYPLKVILAEDEEEIRLLLVDILLSVGIVVRSFNNGELALQEYLEHSGDYDLIISDMKMPIMDGVGLLEEIRTRTDLKQPKFFFTTGNINIDFENTQNHLIDTIDGYFYKPFTPEDVYAQIEKTFPQIFENTPLVN
jgi:signal transduction histidine kinase/CheY-like chemotaxis protein